ncbi:LuxR C-terminal-related transcriptional regulator [Nocardioides conyzicola]|uniref:LuxR C-terminal-related transcriptional regulator n=1 Tax=Nocardioides conyzicola TaxID=1651781 RepID=UPI0031E6CDBA
MAEDLGSRTAEVLTTWELLARPPRTVCVTGEPGAGKSTVLAGVADLAVAADWQVVRLRGRPTEQGVPFAGIVDLLTARGLDVPAPLRARADELVATLAEPVDGGAAGALGLRLAVLGWLVDLGAARPLLVLVDDQQWLDESSWSVLSFAANRVADTPVACLASTRSATGAPGLEDAPTVALRPLDLDRAGALLDGLGIPLEAAVRTAVIERAAGNPLALCEFARVATPTTSAGGETPSVPPKVEAAFAAELPGLPSRTRSALLLAAAGGNDVQVLGQALPTGSVPAALAPAESVGLVTVVEGRVRFRHPLARSTVYDQASTAERVAAHHQLAAVYVDDEPRRTWHRAAASSRPDEELAAELATAASAAHARGAYAEAGRAMVRAAELSPRRSDRDSRMLRALELMTHTGHIARLQALSERIRDESSDPAIRAVAGHRMAYAMAQSMRQAAALDALESSLEELISVDVDAGWASLTTLASLSYQTGRGADRVRAWYDRYVRETRPTGGAFDEVTRAAQAWIEVALAPLSRPPQLVARVRDTRPLDLELGPEFVVPHEVLLGVTAWVLDEPEVASRRLEKAVAMMRRSIGAGQLIQTLMALGQVQFDRGAFADAADTARSMIDIAEADGLGYYRLVGRELLVRVAAVTGEPSAARAQAEAVLRALDIGECAALEANLRVTLARAAFASGDIQESYRHARSLFDRDGTPMHPHVCYRALGDLAAVAARVGEREAVRGVVERAHAHLDGTGNARYTVILQRALALLAEGDEAEAYFELATSNPDAARWPFELAHAQLGYGVWLRRRRRTTQARAHLATAHETFTRLGARAWADAAETELRAAGVAQPGPEPAWDQLTAQERQIVRLAAEGLTNREIGRRLFLSPRTVSTHLYRAFPKLGVASRAQLRDVLDQPDPGPMT